MPAPLLCHLCLISISGREKKSWPVSRSAVYPPRAVPAVTPDHSAIRPFLLTANYSMPFVLLATQFSVPWVVTMALVVHACFFYAVVAPSCGWMVKVVTRFRTQGREVWLTIDDGPDGEASLRLSREMAERGVRATFFVKGENLEKRPEIADALVAAGHSLANHTQTHPAHSFWALRTKSLTREIESCNEALDRAGISVRRWFRSPVGLKNVFLEPILRRFGMRFVGWSIRGGDGVTCDPGAVSKRVAEQAVPGAIILLHEGRARSNEAILRVVDELRSQGYSFVIPGDEQLV